MRILAYAGVIRGRRTALPTPARDRSRDVVAAPVDDDVDELDRLRGFHITGLLPAPAEVTR